MNKTINFKYNTHLIKPHLRKLAMRDARKKLEPQGLSGGVKDPVLIQRYHRTLRELAQLDPEL